MLLIRHGNDGGVDIVAVQQLPVVREALLHGDIIPLPGKIQMFAADVANGRNLRPAAHGPLDMRHAEPQPDHGNPQLVHYSVPFSA